MVDNKEKQMHVFDFEKTKKSIEDAAALIDAKVDKLEWSLNRAFLHITLVSNTPGKKISTRTLYIKAGKAGWTRWQSNRGTNCIADRYSYYGINMSECETGEQVHAYVFVSAIQKFGPEGKGRY
jgi:hypothetical protein